MSRKTKLLILITLSLSVFFIYKRTSHHDMKIVSIGDGLSLGINSYGIRDYSYLDYYKDYLVNNKIKVEINNNYSKEDLTINELLEKIKTKPTIKRNLLEAHLLVLNLGYNDLTYKLSLEDTMNQSILQKRIKEIENDYQNLLIEIRRYYKREIIVVGYYPIKSKDYYWNFGIRKLNNILQSSSNISFIDTSKILSEENKYFSNPNSHYPNKAAYYCIAKEIIEKTLENKEII